MTKLMDLLILPLFRQADHFQADIPGLWAAEPPRRVNRHRAEERLVLHLTLEGNAPLTPEAYQQLLLGLSKSYYKNAGSVTAAMRSNAENLNQYMLDRNMRGSSRGVRAVGALTQVVIRTDTIYFAQSGLCHLYVLKNDRAVHFHDPKLSGRGLGVSRVPRVRYHQESLEPNDHYLLTTNPPPVWTTETLKNVSRMPLKGKYDRLMHRVENDLNAALLYFRKGSGAIRVIKPVEEEGLDAPPDLKLDESGEREVEKTLPGALSALRGILEKKESPGEEQSPPEIPPSSPAGEQEVDEQQVSPREDWHADESAPDRPGAEDDPAARDVGSDWHPGRETLADEPFREEWVPPVSEEREEEPVYPRLDVEDDLRSPAEEPPLADPVTDILKKILAAVGKAVRVSAETAAAVARRILPEEVGVELPRWMMSLIAVAVPIIIVIIASVVYFDRGVDQQYSENFEQASMLYMEGLSLEDAGARYDNLQQAHASIQEALQFKETEEALSLFEEIRTDLDEMNRVTRLEFKPLFTRGLGNNVKITEMVVDAYGDIYALDGENGIVYRIISTAGYQVDPGFICGPIEGEEGIGPLIDIIPLGKDFVNGAVILGIDADHNMTFCYQGGGKSNEVFRDISYSIPKGPVKAMTVSAGEAKNIYILDPVKEAIYIQYVFQQYSTGAEYSGEYDPPFMLDVIDLASNGSELFLLHEDGQITRCTRPNPEGPADCVYPTMYLDDRAGMEPGPILSGAEFSDIKLHSQLGMTLYLLDPEQQALYNFSLQMEYLGQIRPDQALVGGPVTAFTLGKKGELLMAVGEQIYLANLR